MPLRISKPIYFGQFLVTPQVFHLTTHSFCLVNLKPLLPGHVLVSPLRVVPRLRDLTPAETADLFQTARQVGRMLERVFGASALNVAVQDGADAGQSVPHVHAHVIPRRRADLEHRGGSDAIYGMMDGEEGDLGRALQEGATLRGENGEEGKEGSGSQEGRRSRDGFPGVDADERRPRSVEEMNQEAEWFAREMEAEDETQE